MIEDKDDSISTSEVYRGISIHDCQSRERIDGVVKPAIDRVYALADAAALFAYCRRRRHPPEARLFAAAKLEAMMAISASDRRARPDIDLELARACVVGLDSRRYRSSVDFGTILQPSGPHDPDAALPRDPESCRQVEEDLARLRVA